MKLRHLNTFLQFRLLFHEPHCISEETVEHRCSASANEARPLVRHETYILIKDIVIISVLVRLLVHPSMTIESKSLWDTNHPNSVRSL